jgi:thymidylate synthase
MKQYLEILETINKKGTYKPAAREGMPGTKSLFGHQFRHDLNNGFPLLTTKKMFWKGVVVELLWFLRGDTNIKYLVDNGVNIWNEDAYQYYKKVYGEEYSFDSFIERIKTGKYEDFVNECVGESGYVLGDCGYQYGKVWRNWDKPIKLISDENPFKGVDQISNLLNSLRKTPESRRHIITAIDPAHDNNLALYWCHAMFQFNCRPLTLQERMDYCYKVHGILLAGFPECEYVLDSNKVPLYYLDCQLYQRSADVVLGVPFNIASYALLIEILSKMCNMIPGEFIHTFGDVHIYDNHKEAVEEQLVRTPTELPKLKIIDFGNDWTKYGVELFDALNFSDFELDGYNPQSKIIAELSTGLKK